MLRGTRLIVGEDAARFSRVTEDLRRLLHGRSIQ